MRKTLSAIVVAAAAAVGTLIPATAHAASAPTVLWAYSVEGDFARIQVGTLAEAGVASLKIHVIEPQTQQELAVVDSFHRVDGSGDWGVWEADELVVLPDLGYYQLNAEITDNDGVHTAQESVGWLVYVVQMFYKNLHVSNTVKYTAREVTVTGRLMGRWPGTGEEKPVLDYPVEYVLQYGDFVDGVSDNAGQFRLTTEVQAVDDTGYLTTLWDPSRPFYLQAFANTEAPEIHQADTRLTIGLDRDTVAEGEPMTVTGVLTWHAPDGWRPVANAYVAIMSCPGDPDDCTGGLYASAITDEQGRYSVTVTPYLGGIMRAGTYNYDPFVTTTTFATADFTVTHQSRFTDFGGARNAGGQVVLSGHLQFTEHYSPGQIPVEIQFSSDGTSAWHTVRTIDISYNPTNPEGVYFEEYVDGAEAGRWRATYTDPYGFFESSESTPAFVS
jgi:hypothetical protein